MKKNTILLPTDRILPQSFKERLRNILDDNRNDAKRLIEELYEGQSELNDDLTTGGIFTQDDLEALFEFAKELSLPIIVAKNDHGICEFKICKKESAQKLTHFERSGYSISDDSQKLRTLFISNHFSHLNHIEAFGHLLTEVTLPDELPNLIELWLNCNQLAQLTLPEELPNLNNLFLHENKLTQLKLPDELPNLERLGLGFNQLTQLILPDELPNLKALNLTKNQLIQLTLPDELPNLIQLDLDHNKLTQLTLPAQLPNLKSLWLNNNKLIQLTLPDELPNLEVLWLSDNQLTQLTLPNELLNLETLVLACNQLIQVTLHVQSPNLKEFWLDNNKLTQLTLPKTRDNLFGGWDFDQMQTVTAFYNDGQHTFENQSKKTIMNYVRTGIVVND